MAKKAITPKIQAMNMVLTTFTETHRPVTYMRHPTWLSSRCCARLAAAGA